MKKRIAALLLSVVLCFGLAAGALAAGKVTLSGVSSGSKTVTVKYTGLEEGKTYYLCSAAVNGELVWAFDLTAEKSSGSFTVELAESLAKGDTFAVNIPGGGSAFGTAASGSGGGGGGGGGSSSAGGRLSVIKASGGSVTARPADAKAGELVTLTVRPDNGYVLDSLTVTTSDGKTVRLTKINDTTYTFTMPEAHVTVTPVFKAAARGNFPDVAKSSAFYADIAWAAENGLMGGYSDGTFRPNNNTTRQALWMVLSRIDGENPSSMAEARAWAVANGVSDGSNATGGMTRQQMVTMLYRYAQANGYSTSGGVSLSGYPDAGSVAGYARDAMSWAVGNGIVGGTTAGMLNPSGVASRAHFAAFLHRFCTRYGII